MTRRRSNQRQWPAALAAAGCGLWLAWLRANVGRFEVAEASMQPALRPGDYLIAVRKSGLARGDIVVYRNPTDPTGYLIKRVVAVSGEVVSVQAGEVLVDGEVIAEPWAYGPTTGPGEWTVPAGKVFTLGDNRPASSGDGRTSGPIEVRGVFKAYWRYWPPGSLGRV